MPVAEPEVEPKVPTRDPTRVNPDTHELPRKREKPEYRIIPATPERPAANN